MKKVLMYSFIVIGAGGLGYWIFKKKKPATKPEPKVTANESKANKIIGKTPDGRTIYQQPTNGKPERTVYKELGYFADGTPVDFSDLAIAGEYGNQPLD